MSIAARTYSLRCALDKRHIATVCPSIGYGGKQELRVYSKNRSNHLALAAVILIDDRRYQVTRINSSSPIFLKTESEVIHEIGLLGPYL